VRADDSQIITTELGDWISRCRRPLILVVVGSHLRTIYAAHQRRLTPIRLFIRCMISRNLSSRTFALAQNVTCRTLDNKELSFFGAILYVTSSRTSEITEDDFKFGRKISC
jgi:hypothetical protein